MTGKVSAKITENRNSWLRTRPRDPSLERPDDNEYHPNSRCHPLIQMVVEETLTSVTISAVFAVVAESESQQYWNPLQSSCFGNEAYVQLKRAYMPQVSIPSSGRVQYSGVSDRT